MCTVRGCRYFWTVWNETMTLTFSTAEISIGYQTLEAGSYNVSVVVVDSRNIKSSDFITVRLLSFPCAF